MKFSTCFHIGNLNCRGALIGVAQYPAFLAKACAKSSHVPLKGKKYNIVELEGAYKLRVRHGCTLHRVIGRAVGILDELRAPIIASISVRKEQNSPQDISLPLSKASK